MNHLTRDTIPYLMPSATPSRSSGKERDNETGLDYFGARYYGSSIGRWFSPDWSALPQPVPYARLENPQTLNLYSYVQNNPATNRDLDGHVCIFGYGSTCKPKIDPNLPLPPPLKAPKIPPAPFLKANGTFKTADAAGKAAVRAINPTSQKNKAEYGGRVFKIANGVYSYTGPFTQGNIKQVNVDAGVTGNGKNEDYTSPPVPLGTESTGTYHTHPAGTGLTGSEDFSGMAGLSGDRDSSHMEQVATRSPVTDYLGTPSNRVLKYESRTDTTTDITNVPD